MLAAAHVLAMDAKNLLDVVDSVRIRFPNIFSNNGPTTSSANSSTTTTPSAQIQTAQGFNQQTSSTSTTPVNPILSLERHFQFASLNNETQFNQSQENNSLENYQNLQQVHNLLSHSSPPSSLNMSQSYEIEQNNLYSNQQQIGIYDNECMINQQNSDSSKLSSSKPIIAAKPLNITQKLKTNPVTNKFNNVNDKLLDEPLKIIEDPNDLYCNTSSAATSKRVNLPQPVTCQLVQENILTNSQKIMSNKLG